MQEMRSYLTNRFMYSPCSLKCNLNVIKTCKNWGKEYVSVAYGATRLLCCCQANIHKNKNTKNNNRCTWLPILYADIGFCSLYLF